MNERGIPVVGLESGGGKKNESDETAEITQKSGYLDRVPFQVKMASDPFALLEFSQSAETDLTFMAGKPLNDNDSKTRSF